MNRREFLKASGSLALSAAAGGLLASCGGGARPEVRPQAAAEPTWTKLPRWRGFNLLEKFQLSGQGPFREEDFALMAEWGFDFARLPMDYRCWTDPQDWTRLLEAPLAEIDQAVELGRRYGIHVCLNFHRAPGYTVAKPPEPRDLWTDAEAQRVCALHWASFARRYRGVPSSQLSFDLVNEPAMIDGAVYAAAAGTLVQAIRREDPQRLIIADGVWWGSRPAPELIDLRVAQSTRGYAPMPVTHFRAPWVDTGQFPEPAWPLRYPDGRVYGRTELEAEQIAPWRELAARGVGVHVGEFGAFIHTPHAVVLAWMRDCLELWRREGWGWALWNLRGGFGVLDSGRGDVAYETFRGRQLDRAMLELLLAH